MALHNLYRYNEAIDCFNIFIKKNPNDSDAFNNNGLAYSDSRRYVSAIECFDKAIKINPKNSKAISNRKNTNLKLYNDLILIREKKVNNENNYFPNYSNKLNKLNEAIEFYSKAMNINPYDSDAYNNKGLLFFTSYRYNEAIDYFDNAIKINPKNLDAHINKGLALGDLEKFNIT